MATTFKGKPKMLVRIVPPIGTTKHVRFDENGEFTTENERLIARFHHKFDSVPSNKPASEELTDDIEYQDHGQAPAKQYKCNQCDFKSESKSELLAHKKTEHPKEGQNE